MEPLIFYGLIAIVIFVVVTSLIQWILSGDEHTRQSNVEQITDQDAYIQGEKAFIDEVLRELSIANIEFTSNYETKGQYFQLMKDILASFEFDKERVISVLSVILSINSPSIQPGVGLDADPDILLLKKIFSISEGTNIECFPPAAAKVLFELLYNAKYAIRFDNYFDDNGILTEMNFVFNKFNLKLEFSDHNNNEPFEIKLIDLSTNNVIATTTCEYSNPDNPDRSELTDTLNSLISTKGIELVDVSADGNIYNLILFNKRSFDEFNSRYKDNFQALIYPEPNFDI